MDLAKVHVFLSRVSLRRYRQAFYWRNTITSTNRGTLQPPGGFAPLNLDALPAISLNEIDYNTPALRLLTWLNSTALQPIHKASRGLDSEIPFLDIIRVYLLRQASPFFRRSLLTDLWQQTVSPQFVTIWISSLWFRLLMDPTKKHRRLIYIPSSHPLRRLQRKFQKKHTRTHATSSDGTRGATQKIPSQPTLMVFNQDDTYSNLYRYDHLYSSDPQSPLHPDNVDHLSRLGGTLSSGQYSFPYPTIKSRRKLLSAQLKMFISLLMGTRKVPYILLWEIALFRTRSQQLASEIKSSFPQAKVACIIFDLQTPPELIFAFELAGIKTVALQERIDSSFEIHMPYAINTLLTASPYFAKRARDSPAIAVSTVAPVGMWRTDLLLERKGLEISDICPSTHDGIIHIAPYGLDPSPEHSLELSALALEGFLHDILKTSMLWPNFMFVIRGKDNTWTHHPDLSTTLELLQSRANILIDQEYGEIQRSYRILAHSTLLIANYSSLVDEALSVRTPVVIRDFGGNVGPLRNSIMDYLPAGLIATDSPDFHSKVNAILSDGGDAFRKWWEPHRQHLYGDFSDGLVRSRARTAIEQMFGELSTMHPPTN